MSDTGEMTRTRAWLIAARPHTLPAAASPVVVGTGLAVHDGVFAPVPALFALVGAALIQIGTNFANDYFDAEKGADTEDRDGFTRVTAGGIIAPERVKRATATTFGLSILVGLYLVYVGGVPILVVGLASIAAGVLYTGGPYPFGYYGFGDLFVFVFFGLVAVTGTYYVQAAALLAGPFPLGIPAGTVPFEAVLVSLPVAAISTNILVVNNVRDREEDAHTGKRTLAVRFGYGFARAEYVTLFAVAYAVPLLLVARGSHPTVLLPLLTLPLAVRLARTLLTETTGAALNPALEDTGKLLAAYAVLSGVGLALPALL